MNSIGSLINGLERPSAGSEDTAKRVLELCGKISPKNAVFIGDESFTPALIKERTKADVLACYAEPNRAERAEKAGLSAKISMPFEIPVRDNGKWDFIWYNGASSLEGSAGLLEQIDDNLEKGGTAVFRTLCWLIDPSPDTKCYVERRFGKPEALDAVLRNAKEQGFKIRDFYIAPKTDWTHGLYEPLRSAMQTLEGASEDGAETGISELNKEMYMFELHSEEYSFVYYILEK